MKFPNYLLVLLLAAFGLSAAQRADAQLVLTNGNFQNTNGLTPTAGAPGWYDGVPAGWTGNSSTFNVINWNSGNFAANIQTLGPASPFNPLYQSVGQMDVTGDVTLNFSILGFSGTYGIAAAIYNATPGGSPTTTWSALTTASYSETSGSFQTLTASNVSVGTPIAVAFWSWAGAPGIDEVTVTAVPEPSTYALLALSAAGIGAHVVRRRRR